MRALWIVFVVACGDNIVLPDAQPVVPATNLPRDVVDTHLQLDVTALTGEAKIFFAPSTEVGGSLEVGDLAISTVQHAGVDVAYTTANSKLVLALPPSDEPYAVDIGYTWVHHELGAEGQGEGASKYGYTLLWPYNCGNLFPCHSNPADGTTFSLDVTGIPDGETAVFPTHIPAPAPSYQIAWSIDAYTRLDLGTTTNGTMISVWYRGGELAHAQTGTQHLVAAFDWLEQTLGPYTFGNHYGSVSVHWPTGAFGGMEHHPYSHIASIALADEETNVHESAHGWFGDGIRIGCWEDFVLSEGTVSYLAARALDVVAPAVGASVWTSYASELAQIPGSDPVWPQSCGKVDVITDNLFTDAPYMRGAYFYKAVADKVGPAVLDQALATFYKAHASGSARMADMLDTIKTVTGYDPTTCAQMWLLSTTVPAVGPCP